MFCICTALHTCTWRAALRLIQYNTYSLELKQNGSAYSVKVLE